ncbi:hypothetical protein CFP56_038011 [Quercus suber]|uniref:BPL/LPL catalytic domain-containing protein n=1 Tax=Quercus suber TaxID=58331 RepID=A0AAW0LP25_QUESU
MANPSQLPAELLKIECVLCDQIPVVRRFTGRGTVVVDPNTIFVTFICNKDAVAGLQPYPQPIMSWTSALYNQVFQGIGDFHLRENGQKHGLLETSWKSSRISTGEGTNLITLSNIPGCSAILMP